MKSRFHRSTIFGLGMSFAALAAAQQAPSSESTLQSGELEEVMVTGSRLQLTNLTTPTPVTVLSAEDIQKRAPSSIGQLVNELPALRQQNGPVGFARASGSAGQYLLNLRGLGTVDTLVLIDGRRAVATSPQGAVDANIIPSSLLKQIDIVTGGASAAYGSDAVGGVINFLLDSKFEGIRGNLQTSRSQQDDAAENSGSVGFGTRFANDRGHFLFGADASKHDGLGTIYERDWGRIEGGLVSHGAVGSATRPAGTPAQSFQNGVEYSTTPGGVITAGPLAGTAFDANGNPYALQYGTLATGGLMYNTNSNYGYGPNSFFNLVAPNERASLFTRVNFELTDTTEVFVEGQYAQQESDNRFGIFTNSTVISRNNPYLPAATLAAMGTAPSITVGRVNADYGQYETIQSYDYWRATAGISGEVFGGWNWDAYAQRGEVAQDLKTTAIETPNVAAATYALTVGGAPACTTVPGTAPTANPNLNATSASRVQPGCSPFNLFGSGNGSAAAYDYLVGWQSQVATLTQDVAEINLRGQPFDLWAGPLAVAVGVGYRKDTLQNDPAIRRGYSPFTVGNYNAYDAESNVKEIYGETSLPLLNDITAVKSLDLNGAARYTDYSNIGAVTTWKLGMTYQPVDDWTFRVTRSQDIRAPTLFEAYGLGALNSSVINNPFTTTQNTVSWQKIEGGDSLQEETAKTVTAGLAFTPGGGIFDGLNLSVDYFDIELKDVITSLSVQSLTDKCFAGGAQYCSLITFGPGNVITYIGQAPQNLNELATSGVDFEIGYRVPAELLGGRISLRAIATRTFHMATTDINGATIDQAGSQIPKWRGNFSLSYDRAAFSTTATVMGFSDVLYNPALIGPDNPNYNPNASNSINKNLFPGMTYLRWQAQYEFTTGEAQYQVYGVIDNALDKDPPRYGDLFNAQNGGMYDLIGRTFKLGARVSF